VIVSVSDEGIGIPLEEQDRIFERFYRVDDALSRRTAGSGLGCIWAKAVIEAHGGRIWVESAPDAGRRSVLPCHAKEQDRMGPRGFSGQ